MCKNQKLHKSGKIVAGIAIVLKSGRHWEICLTAGHLTAAAAVLLAVPLWCVAIFLALGGAATDTQSAAARSASVQGAMACSDPGAAATDAPAGAPAQTSTPTSASAARAKVGEGAALGATALTKTPTLTSTTRAKVSQGPAPAVKAQTSAPNQTSTTRAMVGRGAALVVKAQASTSAWTSTRQPDVDQPGAPIVAAVDAGNSRRNLGYAIEQVRLTQNGAVAYVDFDQRRVVSTGKASGYIWGVAEFIDAHGRIYHVPSKPSLVLDHAGRPLDPRGGERFAVKRHKQRSMAFNAPEGDGIKLRAVRLGLSDREMTTSQELSLAGATLRQMR